jgi:thiamine-monophosphate kinase
VKESAAIRALVSVLERARGQLNAPFEADAELIRLGDTQWGFTIDEYSPDEDFFSSYFPATLGSNLVTCTVSDLLAAGVRPAFYLHAMTLPEDEGFWQGLFDGIRQGLVDAGCHLLGGDTSFAPSWRYVGVAFGACERPLLRSGAQPGDRVYATGPFGSGNRQALLQLLLRKGELSDTPELRAVASPRFVSRLPQAELAWRYARFSIDSSDGYVNAFADLARANPDLGFVARIGEELVDRATAEFTRRMRLAPETALFGSAGEYELLFGVPTERARDFEQALGACGAAPLLVGEVTAERGLHCDTERGRSILPLERLPDPRSLDPAAYIRRLAALAEEILAGTGP